MTQNEEKNQPIGKDPVIKQMIVFINKYSKTVIINIFCKFKKVEGIGRTRMGLYLVSPMGGRFRG